jgi:hypothetical protein
MTRKLTLAITASLFALGLVAGCTDADGDGIDDAEECEPGQSDPDGDGRCPQNLVPEIP